MNHSDAKLISKCLNLVLGLETFEELTTEFVENFERCYTNIIKGDFVRVIKPSSPQHNKIFRVEELVGESYQLSNFMIFHDNQLTKDLRL